MAFSPSSAAATAVPLRPSKRPYQPDITSYFARSRTSDLTNSATGQWPIHQASLSPALPLAVQSNLLNVGMRVRKAVPEGYKTSAADIYNNVYPTIPASAPLRWTNRNVSRVTELTPLCGLHKTGFYSTQDEYDTTLNNDSELDLSTPGLSFSQSSQSSQESVASNHPIFLPLSNHFTAETARLYGRKRPLSAREEDEEDENQAQDDVCFNAAPPADVHFEFCENGDVSLHDLAAAARPQEGKPSRAIAPLRRRRTGRGKEAVAATLTEAADVDFEEAVFLGPAPGFGDGCGGGGEVVMSEF